MACPPPLVGSTRCLGDRISTVAVATWPMVRLRRLLGAERRLAPDRLRGGNHHFGHRRALYRRGVRHPALALALVGTPDHCSAARRVGHLLFRLGECAVRDSFHPDAGERVFLNRERAAGRRAYVILRRRASIDCSHPSSLNATVFSGSFATSGTVTFG
ncbi:MAG: hypothetical protein QOK08_375 [Actinomycetota bacterium]|nr:hypothetical protein [Actinomycetota bacterium]